MEESLLPAHVRAFLDPGFYPHPAPSIRLLQTHISWIVLTGPFAYKIKKPVDLGFVDFSSPAKRLAACRKELMLNRRLAPAIYREVLPICGNGRHFQLGGSGAPFDHCLKMIQFDQDDLFSNRVERDGIDAAWMDRLATTIATFHGAAERSSATTGADATVLLAEHVTANLEVARRHPETGLSPANLASLETGSEAWLARLTPALRERQQQGMVRDCHGDLHLGNITLFGGEPVPFDCIEFNDTFRIIDTMNDIAFLIMDCDARNHSSLGLRFLSRYLERSGDYAGLEALPLFLSYRAAVRGKVACLTADDPGLMPAEREKQLQSARHYFELATSYLQPARPRLFAIGGLSGSGKSHLALLSLEHERAVIIRSDATRKRIASRYPGLELYGDEMHRNTYRAMFDAARTALAAGMSVILDATFLHEKSRQSVVELSRQAEAPLTFYWIDMAEAELRRRIATRTETGRDISDADLAVLEIQLAGYRRPTEPWIVTLTGSDRWPETS